MLRIKCSFLSAIIASLFFVILPVSKVLSQTLPSFQMQLANGQTYTSKNVLPAKPLVLIYFAPDCDHCTILMDAIFKKIDQFKSSQIVMVTFKPLDEVVDFEKHYQTSKYQNIKVGTEKPMFYFKNYYQLVNTPFTALYDKKGKLIASYKKETPVDELIRQLKMIK
ncbi:MAG: redoxin domain-containing protein [Ferruginibacter sp.]